MEEATFELIKKLSHTPQTGKSGKETGIHELLEEIADFIFTNKEAVAPIFMQALARAEEDARFRERIGTKYYETLVNLYEDLVRR